MARQATVPSQVDPSGLPDNAAETERLIAVVQELSLARDLRAVMSIVRHAARELTGADGATFILRDRDCCFYADEEAIGPLWKGRRFPMATCISGWAMLHAQPAVIEDIYVDDRIPHDAYRPTFVKSLAVVPIRVNQPIGAIGNYWARPHLATDRELKILQALANSASIALENVQLYTDLQVSLEESRRAVRARDEFLSVASHELRTPLTAMRLQLQALQELLRRQPSREARLQDRVDRAVTSNERLADLVESLLDVSRVSLGRLALQPDSFDLVELVNEVMARFLDQAAQVGCELRIAAPAAAGVMVGRWDRDRIDQVLTNLLANAIKYGAGKPVEVALERTPAAALLRVKDQGLGISAEDLPRLFERFTRAASPRNYGGLGLGLYLSRQIVEAHGGSIRAQSLLGQGAVFEVELPWDHLPEPRP